MEAEAHPGPRSVALVHPGGQAVAARAPDRVHVTSSVPVCGRSAGGDHGKGEGMGFGAVSERVFGERRRRERGRVERVGFFFLSLFFEIFFFSFEGVCVCVCVNSSINTVKKKKKTHRQGHDPWPGERRALSRRKRLWRRSSRGERS